MGFAAQPSKLSHLAAVPQHAIQQHAGVQGIPGRCRACVGFVAAIEAVAQRRGRCVPVSRLTAIPSLMGHADWLAVLAQLQLNLIAVHHVIAHARLAMGDAYI